MKTSIDVRTVTLVKQLYKPCPEVLIILLFAFSSFFPSAFRHSCVKITSSPSHHPFARQINIRTVINSILVEDSMSQSFLLGISIFPEHFHPQILLACRTAANMDDFFPCHFFKMSLFLFYSCPSFQHESMIFKYIISFFLCVMSFLDISNCSTSQLPIFYCSE